METPALNPTSTSGQGARQPSRRPSSPKEIAQLALPLTDSERKESRKQLDKLHPGNRLRLMFGQPLLPKGPESGESP